MGMNPRDTPIYGIWAPKLCERMFKVVNSLAYFSTAFSHLSTEKTGFGACSAKKDAGFGKPLDTGVVLDYYLIR
jgi:hypothetical protein